MTASDAGSPVSRESLAGLTALGCLSALWSVVLWAELWLARVTGSAVCSFGDSGCGALWDSRFARTVHELSAVPVAGWGLAWGLVAAGLPLLQLVRGEAGALQTAVRLMAGAGAVSVAGLALVSAGLGTLCTGCVVVYVLVGGYAGIALGGWPGAGWPRLARAAAAAVAATAGVLLALAPVGRATPRSLAAAGRATIGTTAQASPADAVARMLAALSASQAQTVADSLGLLRATPVVRPMPEPRSLLGAAQAPLRIVAWSDVRCPHCAELHETLRLLLETYPGKLSVDARFFPLDGACNRAVPSGGDPARCLAARAATCFEGRADALDFASELFAEQETLDAARVRALAAKRLGAQAACLDGREAANRVAADVEQALGFGIEGTPLVVLNGRTGTSFPPFLEAMVLAGGETAHPAFAVLPPANPNAHLH